MKWKHRLLLLIIVDKDSLHLSAICVITYKKPLRKSPCPPGALCRVAVSDALLLAEHLQRCELVPQLVLLAELAKVSLDVHSRVVQHLRQNIGVCKRVEASRRHQVQGRAAGLACR